MGRRRDSLAFITFSAISVLVAGCPSPDDPVCGDGEIAGAEQCDDGNTVSGDGCSSTCQLDVPVCGDGILAGQETCDDGNIDSGDGCSAFCQLEPTCGDGVQEQPEQCDDGNTVDGDGCSSTCRLDVICGDGVVEIPEQCDDGNTSPGDGCDATCVAEGAPPACGPAVPLSCGDSLSADSAMGGLAVNGDYGDCTAGGVPLDGPALSYTFTPTVSEEVTIRLTDLDTDLDLFVIADTGGCDPDACVDGMQSVNNVTADEAVTFSATAGTTYHLVADAVAAGGPFKLWVTCPSTPVCGDGVLAPPETCEDGNTANGDGCDDGCQVEGTGCGVETPIDCEVTTMGDTSNGFPVVDTWPCLGISEIGPEVAYVFQPTTSEIVSVFLVGLDTDLDLLVVEDPTGSVGCDPAACDAGLASIGGGTVSEGLSFPVTAGSTYYLVVESFTSTGSDFNLRIFCPSVPVCGDGVLDPGEECDDDNTVVGDGCDGGCLFEPAVCGDMVLQNGEECDDGNPFGGDGCSSTCAWEPAICGDGVLQNGEDCDDGNLSPGDGCDDLCMVEPPVCGDGNVDGSEQCDDGNTTPGDGCDDVCMIEPTCGNSMLEPTEQCDDGNTAAGDGCSATCQIECGPQPAVQIACGGMLALFGDTSTGGMANLSSYTCLSSPEDGPEMHFEFVAPADDVVRFDLSVLSADLDLIVLEADADVCTVCSSDAASTNTGTTDELVEISVSAGRTYHVVVESFDAVGGPFTLFAGCASDSVCGDGVEEAGESCDDGNTVADDGCDATCQLEPLCIPDPLPAPVTLTAGVPVALLPVTPDLDRGAVSCGGPAAGCSADAPDAVIQVTLPAGATDLEVLFDHTGGDHLYAIVDPTSATCGEVDCFDPHPLQSGVHLFAGVSSGAAPSTLMLVVEACDASSAVADTLTLTTP